MDREAWRTAFQGIAKRWTQLSNWTEVKNFMKQIIWRVILSSCWDIFSQMLISAEHVSCCYYDYGILQSLLSSILKIEYIYITVVIRSPIGLFISSIWALKMGKSWQCFISLFHVKHKHINWIYNIKFKLCINKGGLNTGRAATWGVEMSFTIEFKYPFLT